MAYYIKNNSFTPFSLQSLDINNGTLPLTSESGCISAIHLITMVYILHTLIYMHILAIKFNLRVSEWGVGVCLLGSSEIKSKYKKLTE